MERVTRPPKDKTSTAKPRLAAASGTVELKPLPPPGIDIEAFVECPRGQAQQSKGLDTKGVANNALQWPVNEVDAFCRCWPERNA